MASGTYFISGLHCGGCVKLLTRIIGAVPGVQGVSIELASGKALVEMESKVPYLVLAAAVEGAGVRYRLLQRGPGLLSHIGRKLKTYLPLLIALAVVVAWTAVRQRAVGFELHDALHDFMGGFFLLFGTLKALNWRAFSDSYAAYDPLAARSRWYAYAYPAIELLLGVAYQFRFSPEWLPNLVTVIVLSSATIGVIKKLRRKEMVQCACLGGFFSIPVSWLTVFENILMIGMAIYMQVLILR